MQSQMQTNQGQNSKQKTIDFKPTEKIIRSGRMVFTHIDNKEGDTVLECKDYYAIEYIKYNTGEYKAYDDSIGIIERAGSKNELRSRVSEAVCDLWIDRQHFSENTKKELERNFESV